MLLFLFSWWQNGYVRVAICGAAKIPNRLILFQVTMLWCLTYLNPFISVPEVNTHKRKCNRTTYDCRYSGSLHYTAKTSLGNNLVAKKLPCYVVLKYLNVPLYLIWIFNSLCISKLNYLNKTFLSQFLILLPSLFLWTNNELREYSTNLSQPFMNFINTVPESSLTKTPGECVWIPKPWQQFTSLSQIYPSNIKI